MAERLSTSCVKSAEAFSYWADLICEVYVGLDCAAPNTKGFSGSIERTELGGVVATMVEANRQHVRRTRNRIRKQPSSDVLLSVQLAGPATIIQDERAAVLRPGDATLYDAERPYEIVLDGNFSMLVFQMPRQLLEGRIGDLKEWTARRVVGSHGAGRLASQYLRTVYEEADSLDVSRAMAVRPGLELFVNALTAVHARQRNADHQTTLLFVAKELIEASLTDAGFTRERLAKQLHVSVRQLSRIFQLIDSSPHAYLRERRLEAAKTSLMREPGVSVSEIAHRFVFSDASHFCRCFRDRYGVTPRDYRLSSSGQGGDDD